mmetsp:Transcript_20954/g.30208  ORF Transcript_20954/g.30208 Transcript_20954/m.30208 type:complete len:334 (+) Transcript_20954:75-1076(+)|eukprot:CAMPEP_0185025458 /NCGR_PEP_ID=MMETSP1103-20130426/8406_1 /TAXON_ID=36769 /ORGANISM="Paraphysomonas bandaiensis, Strain Caron Lab Isolate" /LENGTH=333 /DNA_ID=CAMNT_0027558659 /DNA_START=46 /DNA_END=1047 /DNA_ORIENTATION=+
MISLLRFLLVSVGICAATNSTTGNTITLPQLNVLEGSVTVSGLSSGGFMAVQMHVAYSSLFSGVGVFAGGPYFCAQGTLTLALDQCMYNVLGGPQISKLISYTNDQAAKGTIDPTENMADDKVYVFSGSKDTTVYPAVVKTLEDYYAPFVNSPLTTEYTIPAQHCIPSLDYGEPCGINSSPYIGDCEYSGAGHAFETFYGDLSSGTAKESNLFQFDQTEFFTGSGTSINDFGFVYIPTACSDGSTACRLHMSFHGCAQDYASIGDVWADHAGYNDWAEANDIIVVYPYAKKDVSLGNSNACWDWWGYTGPDYALQAGVQMEFSKEVLDRLMGN